MLCKCLHVTRQGYYQYLRALQRPSKDELLLALITRIREQDQENETFGWQRMQSALQFYHDTHVGRHRLTRIMKENSLLQKKKRKPNGLTKADKEAMKSDDLLRRDFKAGEPNMKIVTDMTEIKGKDGKLYVSAAFDCYDSSVLGLSMATNMRTELVTTMIDQVVKLHGAPAIIHSDRGSQYTSNDYRETLKKYGIKQSMNSAGGRCHDNAKCESMWARFKEEKTYRIDSTKYTVEQLKMIVFRYFMSYWNNRRICTAIGGVPPAFKRKTYFESQAGAAVLAA
jgi:transposase InsO family protein